MQLLHDIILRYLDSFKLADLLIDYKNANAYQMTVLTRKRQPIREVKYGNVCRCEWSLHDTIFNFTRTDKYGLYIQVAKLPLNYWHSVISI